MARPPQTEVRFRIVIRDPVPGVAYSLQDKKSQPVRPQVSDGSSLTFEFPVRVADGPKFFGEHVRAEGPDRRFVYIATGKQAGDPTSCWSRRMKIDIHTIPASVLARATLGGHVEAEINGTGKDGGPACATVRPSSGWQHRP